ncbi:MAG: hypothetical protein K0B06_04480 [Brevefilum sp.]|nr:hypothetical protein [Brevefilum sp.]
MKTNKFLMLAFVVIPLLVISACSTPPDGQQEEGLEQLVETFIAQTLDVQQQIEVIVTQTMVAMPTTVEEQAPIEEPSPQATPTLTPTATATATEMPLPTATAISSVPLAEVSVATNCRTGPGKIYDWVSVLPVGRQVEVVARNASGTYWVVQNPAGAGTCWLWGNYARVSGQTADLPVWAAPPTPTPIAGLTPTPTKVVLEVSVPTNCRVGPGMIYDIVSVLRPGKTVNVIGRHASADFWVVENPDGSGHCWVWGEYAKFSGSPASLPVWEAPPAPTPSAGVTPTPTGVVLSVSVPTNCRVGPGKAYEIVSVLQPGKTVNVIGRHGTADYWVIENPEGSGHCWVWGEYAKLTGSTANLPVWDPPATPTPSSVTLQVRVDTNCRTGPGQAYEILTILRIGKIAEVIGRNAAGTYWVIKNPTSAGHCWVWGNYASLTGPIASLLVWDPPPTPTPTK